MRKPRIGMVERAVIAEKWRASQVDAAIHALMSDDSDNMVNLAGRMFYVALGACAASGIDHDDPDVRIVRGAVNAVHDQAGEAFIPAARRVSISSGLQAVSRIVGRVERKTIVDAACDLELRLRRGDVRLSDFEALLSA